MSDEAVPQPEIVQTGSRRAPSSALDPQPARPVPLSLRVLFGASVALSVVAGGAVLADLTALRRAPLNSISFASFKARSNGCSRHLSMPKPENAVTCLLAGPCISSPISTPRPFIPRFSPTSKALPDVTRK